MKKVGGNAFGSSIDGAGCCGGSAVGGEPDTDAVHDQIDFERRGGDRGGSVASKHFWIHAFDFTDARGRLAALASLSIDILADFVSGYGALNWQ